MKGLFFLLFTFLSCIFVFGQNTNTEVEKNNSGLTTPAQNKPTARQEEEKSVTKPLKKEAVQSKTKAVSKDFNKEVETQNAQTQINKAKISLSQTYQNFRNQESSRSISIDKKNTIMANVSTLKAYSPGSYDYNFYQYLAHRFDKNYYTNLQKATKINPEYKQVQDEYFAYHLANGNTKNIDSILSSETIEVSNYYKDLLASAPQKSTLLVHGVGDLKTLFAQKNKSKNTDITIVAFDLLNSATYRSQLISKGFTMPKSEEIDTAFLKDFCKLNQSKNLYLSLNFPKNYFKPIINNIQLLGLTFAYNSAIINIDEENFNLLKQKWNMLSISATQQTSNLSSNYLPSLLLSKSYLERTKNEVELSKVKELINQLANRTNKTQEIKEIER